MCACQQQHCVEKSNNQIWSHTMVANTHTANYAIDATIKFINGMFMFCCWEHRHKFHLALHLKLSNFGREKNERMWGPRTRTYHVTHFENGLMHAPSSKNRFWLLFVPCMYVHSFLRQFEYGSEKRMPDERKGEKKSFQSDVDVLWCDHGFQFFPFIPWCSSKLISMIAKPSMIMRIN